MWLECPEGREEYDTRFLKLQGPDPTLNKMSGKPQEGTDQKKSKI